MISAAVLAKLRSMEKKRVQTTERPVPRWAERTAHVIPLLVLPWCLWRLPFAFGFSMGSTEDPGPMPAWARLGGKRIPPLAAVVPAVVGGVVMTGVLVLAILTWLHVPGTKNVEYRTPGWLLLSQVCLAPGLLWGPLVLLLARACYIRRRRPARLAG